MKVIELVCWILGLLLFAGALSMRASGEVGLAKGLEAFEASLSATIATNTATDTRTHSSNLSIAAPDQTLWSKERKLAYNNSVENQAKAPGSDTPLALLNIPSLNLRVPVYDTATAFNMNRGVGKITGTAALHSNDNTGIAGHRDGFFRPLKDIALGDLIELQGINETSRYRVSELKIVEPDNVNVLYPTQTSRVTLVTCYPFYYVGHALQRFIVVAEVVAEVVEEATADTITKAIDS